MKGLIKNYINLLTLDKLKDFSLKNDILLSDSELEYLLNLIKNNYEDIIKDENKYLEDVKHNVEPHNYEKIKNLFLYYKKRYKGYLF